MSVPHHPYRECAPPSEPDSREPARVAPDDVVVALLLLVVGSLGVLSGLTTDRQVPLTLGLVLLASSVKVARAAGDSRRSFAPLGGSRTEGRSPTRKKRVAAGLGGG